MNLYQVQFYMSLHMPPTTLHVLGNNFNGPSVFSASHRASTVVDFSSIKANIIDQIYI